MKNILVVLLVAFIIIQFFRIDKNNPPVNEGMDFLTVKQTPEPLAATIRQACYDCHSNQSVYPWYSNIQPFGWFLKSHIEEGRKHLNFSLFATYETKRQIHKMEEAAEMVQSEEMPLPSYTLIHEKAKLTDSQRRELAEYFRKIGTSTAQNAENLGNSTPNILSE